MAEISRELLSLRLSRRVRPGAIPTHDQSLGACLLYTGPVNAKGYGIIAVGTAKNALAHRVSWFVETGAWPEPCALHSCDTPACVRFSHLREGTHAENAADRDSRGRRVAPQGSNHGRAKLTESDVRAIRQARTSGAGLKRLAAIYGVTVTNIRMIDKRRTWRHVP